MSRSGRVAPRVYASGGSNLPGRLIIETKRLVLVFARGPKEHRYTRSVACCRLRHFCSGLERRAQGACRAHGELLMMLTVPGLPTRGECECHSRLTLPPLYPTAFSFIPAASALPVGWDVAGGSESRRCSGVRGGWGADWMRHGQWMLMHWSQMPHLKR